MRLNRLRQMTLTEVAFRSRQKAAIWADRIAAAAGPRPQLQMVLVRHAPAVAADDTAIARFRETAPARFFPGPVAASTPEMLARRMPAARQDLVEAADALLARRFDLLGYRHLSFGDAIDWHCDPVAGHSAARVHWSRLDPLDPHAVGDSKVIWELNRHQWLVTLGQAYQATGDARYAREAMRALDDWARDNPYGIGINWASSLELACRLISWSWLLVLLRDADAVSPARYTRILSFLWMHADHVERYLSYYSSPNTHLTIEALGLVYAGTVFAEFEEAQRWRDLGAGILLDERRRQILADGIHAEQATCYHRYTIEIYLHYLLLSERNQRSVPGDVRGCIEQMVEYLLAVCDRNGAMPATGDADGGWLLPLSRRAPNDCRGVFALAAAVFDRADFAWAAGGPAAEILWLLGADGLARFDRLTPQAPSAPASRVFPIGGYAVMRDGWDSQGHQLVMDVGPLGCAASGAHGHADLLSVQCRAFGEEYLVDAGTYCYTTEPAWRDYFRSTSAHSTVTIDGLSQARPDGTFKWHRRPAACLRRWQSTPAFDYADGEHDAYADLADPVRHRRRVLFVKPSYWVVVDDLIGGRRHHISVRFQFAARPVTLGPGLWASAEGRGGTGVWLGAFAAFPLEATLRQGEVAPLEGWVSSDYGRRHPAPLVSFNATASLPARIVSLIIPVAELRAGPPRVERISDAGGELIGLRVEDRDCVWIGGDDVSVVEKLNAKPDEVRA